MKKILAGFLLPLVFVLLCAAMVVAAVWLYVHGHYVAGALLLLVAFGAAFGAASADETA